MIFSRHRRVWFAVTASCLFALLLHAAVYQTGGAKPGNVMEPFSFGRCVYRAVMRINGDPAEVTVVACEGGEQSLRAAFQAEERAGTGRYSPGESLGVGQATRDGRTVGVVSFAPSGESPFLMVAVAQESLLRGASSRSDVRHRIEGVPVPPEARVLGCLENTDTRTSLERLRVRMPVEGVLGYYDARMAREGWSRLFPATRDGGLQVFVKGSDLCCVRVSSEDSGGESLVTLLHKRGAVK